MKKYAYILIAAAAVLAACGKEEAAPETENPGEEPSEQITGYKNPVTITFTADAGTKVHIEGEGTEGTKKAVWDDNDEIQVAYYYDGAKQTKTVKADTYGDASTTFTLTLEQEELDAVSDFYAVYPSSLTTTLDDSGNFTVNFRDNRDVATSFGEAAWYAAKTTKAAKSFAFHPISTVVKFSVNDTDAESVYFRSMGGSFGCLQDEFTIDFDKLGTGEAPFKNIKPAAAGYITVNVKGKTGPFYLTLPSTNETAENTTNGDGFIFKIKKTDAHIPAAYYSDKITLTPGKLYNIKNPIDAEGKIIYNYYVSPDGTGTGLSLSSPASISTLEANQPAFKYNTKSSAYLRDGITVNLLGGNYTSPITLKSEASVERTVNIVGGADGNTTTFTTTEASTFGNAYVKANLSNITFSGCSTYEAVYIATGSKTAKVTFDNVHFTGNSARGVYIASGNPVFTNCTFTGNAFSSSSRGSAAGGVIYVSGGNNTIASFSICTFDGNSNSANSGGVFCVTNGGTQLSCEGCNFTSNSANSGGVFLAGNGVITLTTCTIGGASDKKNTATSNGGVFLSTSTDGAKIKINGGEISYNDATNGGVLYANKTVTYYFKNVSILNNSAKTEGGVIFVPNGTKTTSATWAPIFYFNACKIIDNTASQNGRAIYLNPSSYATETSFATLCINNSSIYNTTAFSATNPSLICNKGKSLILNSSLTASVGGWGTFALGCHSNFKDSNGCLLLNSIILNQNTSNNAIHPANTSYSIIANNCIASKYPTGISTFSTPNTVTEAPTLNANNGVLTWDGVTTLTKLSADDILNELKKEESGTAVYALAADFITWLEGLEYEYGGSTYNAFQVDINGKPRTASAYWPGCYQND